MFVDNDSEAQALWPLELAVMEVVWEHGEMSVSDVATLLGRPLAYTTVMTTLVRLHTKGWLTRRKRKRLFLYSARIPRSEWEWKCASVFMTGFLSARVLGNGQLISCFVDAFEYDEGMLDRLEEKIRQRRLELERS